ncbi:MAG: MoxR family ATPase [Spirochaetaceae bacterium]|nr:MAG: MoxR family ATPase [Spirochaetaceae bacterium]
MEQKTDAPTFENVRSTCDRISAEIERAIIGKTDVIANVLVAFLAGGHILFEDLPGLGKTVAAKSLATALGLSFKRIQFTPDLLPGDITGGYVYNRKDETFVLRKGPIFAHFLLADEINRASPRTQSALLEAMQERHVTIEGETIDLPSPFTVVATQNPIEYEGTFPLPEAQLDRFMVRLSVGYPSADAEQEILRRRRERKTADVTIHGAVSEDEIHAMRAAIEEIHIAEEIERYIVGIVDGTRRDRRVAVGASPRGALALQDLARAHAAVEGREFVIPDDVKKFAVAALAHRLVLVPDLWTERAAAADVVKSVVDAAPVPVIRET